MNRLFPTLVLVLAGLAVPAAGFAATEGPATEGVLMATTPLVTWLAALPVILPLLGSAVALLLLSRPAWQPVIALVFVGTATIAAVLLGGTVIAQGPLMMAPGSWVPPFGIVLAVDSLSALFVILTCLVSLIALNYARSDVGEAGARHGFYAFYCLLTSGVCGAFSTGDIFNLYVWFEVFLVSSFGMMVVGGSRVQLDGAVKYGVLNLIATTIFLVAVGVLYGAFGTLNMADLTEKIANGAGDGAPLVTLGALFVMAFAMKAAAFPLHFWLPASYPTPKIVVAALFSGLLTKVGVYALLRVMVMIFGAAGAAFLPLIAVIGMATALITALAALTQTDLKRVAAFLVISGVGLMLIGLGLGTRAGLSGTIVYAVHSILAMTALFLVVGLVERAAGTDAMRGGGVYGERSLLSILFLVVGLATAGLPPFSGFFPKLMLIEASLRAGTDALAVAAVVSIILSGLLTTVAVGRVWILVFLRPVADAPAAGGAAAALPSGQMQSAVILAALITALGIAPSIVIDPAVIGADGLIDPSRYVSTVLGARAGE